MHALILAAGMGKRLGELTADRTKGMVEVFGKPILQRMLEQLEQHGIRHVTIVTGYCACSLKEQIGTSYGNLTIEYIDNPIYDKTNNIYSLYLAKEVLLEDDTILLESDLVFEDAVLASLIDDPRPNLAVVAKYASWMDGTVLELDADDSILGFIPKKRFDYQKIEDYFKTVNIYRFSKEFSQSHYVPFLEAYCKAMGHNEYYEQVLQILTHLNDLKLRALRLGDEKWYEIDDIQDLANAETLFAPEDEELASYQSRFGGYWRFPFLLDYCYLVNPFFPPERLIQEIKANFDTLLTQYPSGQSVLRLLGARMFGTHPEQIVVGNGAAELIQALQASFGGVTGVVRPSFEEYAHRTDPQKLKVFAPGAPHFRYSVDDLLEFCETENVDRLILVNPDNPSGHYLPAAEVVRLLQCLQAQGRELVLDESFVDFSEEGQSFLSASLLGEHENLVVIKSVSKSYGVPGLRLGVAATANKERLQDLEKGVAIWNINSFGEFFMQIIGKYESEYRQGCQLLINERARFGQRLAATEQLRVLKSQSNYFFCEVLLPETPGNLAKKLLRRHNVLIRDCSGKPGIDGPYVRIAIRSPEENDRLITALHELDAEQDSTHIIPLSRKNVA